MVNFLVRHLLHKSYTHTPIVYPYPRWVQCTSLFQPLQSKCKMYLLYIYLVLNMISINLSHKFLINSPLTAVSTRTKSSWKGYVAYSLLLSYSFLEVGQDRFWQVSRDQFDMSSLKCKKISLDFKILFLLYHSKSYLGYFSYAITSKPVLDLILFLTGQGLLRPWRWAPFFQPNHRNPDNECETIVDL